MFSNIFKHFQTFSNFIKQVRLVKHRFSSQSLFSNILYFQIKHADNHGNEPNENETNGPYALHTQSNSKKQCRFCSSLYVS